MMYALVNAVDRALELLLVINDKPLYTGTPVRHNGNGRDERAIFSRADPVGVINIVS